ncbi:MAG TPA: right-handed parallel beta-helix repeat-containing protein [Puia sp.]|nr:right-handed parallel beta-helix repeat-containing protein [Puia sp.]
MFHYKAMLTLFVIIYNCFWQPHIERNMPITTKGRAYYVSPNGNDKNEGTRKAAFQSIQRVNNLHLNPGDSILFEGSQRFAGSLKIDSQNSGDQFHPIVISSYGNGMASILGENGSAIIIQKSSWLKLNQLALFGSGRKKGNTRDGLLIQNSSHISANTIIISGFQKSGLLISSSSDISVRNIFAHENGAAGISVEGIYGIKKSNHNIYIAHCRVENNPGDPSNLTNHSGNGIVVGSCSKVLIEYCTATNNGWDMPRIGNGPVGIWAYEADSVIIQHCLSYRNKTSVGAADGGGFDLDGGVTHSIVQYCLSFENQGAGYCIFQYLYASPWHDNIFRFNISINDGSVSDAGAGLYIWNSSRDSNQFYNSLVYNNSIYNSKVAAISFSELSKRKGFAFYNNIFVGKDSLVKGYIDNDTFIGNDWWSLSGRTVKEMISGKSTERNVNPKFKERGMTNFISAEGFESYKCFKISSKSPLRNNGIDLFNLYGINNGGLDFNSGKPPAKGIGASF